MKKNNINNYNVIDFDNFNVFDFYNEYKNLKRIYLFGILNEFNFISEHNGNFCITFDSLTKLGNMIYSISSPSNDNNLNKFLINIIKNPLIGYALPIFKYKNKVYSKTNEINKIFYLNKSTVNDELNLFINNITDITIIYSISLNNIISNELKITYQSLKSLENKND